VPKILQNIFMQGQIAAQNRKRYKERVGALRPLITLKEGISHEKGIPDKA
jgi:hypothetical protein